MFREILYTWYPCRGETSIMYRHGGFLSPGSFQITTEKRGKGTLFWYPPYASSVHHQQKGKYLHFSANSHHKSLWRKEQHAVMVEKFDTQTTTFLRSIIHYFASALGGFLRSCACEGFLLTPILSYKIRVVFRAIWYK